MRARSAPGTGALDLIEEATQLLRRAPASALLSYYVGAVPAMLGFLYFFADMSRGAFARSRLIEAALGAAVAYLWMKCWHAVFARSLLASLAAEPAPRWTLPRIGRLIFVQASLQPTGLFARPFAAQILIPYVWVYSFYQNVGILGDGESASLREVVRRAATQAGLHLRQAHLALALVFLFAIFVALNACVAVILTPQLLKMFLGIETVFSRSPEAMLNTTVFAAIAALTYLVFDPLRKALFVLRCFHGSARQSGDDLRVKLRTIKSSAPHLALAAALALMLVSTAPHSRAQEPVSPPSVAAPDLDRSIERVLQRREYTWRLPREKVPETEKGWLTAFVEDVFDELRRWVKKGLKFAERVFQKVRDFFGGSRSSQSSSGSGWSTAGAVGPILYVTIVLLVAALGVVLWRMRRNLRAPMATAVPVTAVPDLRSENVLADELPEDGWLQLARELMDAGELRLALRASYLAGLAHLGHRQLVTIARHKSNHDYDRELRRRARSREELVAAFDANMRAFESAWYGLHEVTRETLGGFNENLQKIRAC